MSPPFDRRTIWFVAPFIMLLLCAALGLRNGPEALKVAATRGQQLAAFSEVGYGVFGCLAALLFYQGRRAAMFLMIAWATLMTVTGALAPVVWGGASVPIGILSAAGTAAVATLVLQLARRALRPVA
jgi:hypothetical protein